MKEAARSPVAAGVWSFPGALRRPREWAPLAVILLAAAVFFWPYFLQGKIFLAADALYQHFPWVSYAPPNYRAHNTLITDPVNANFSDLYNQQIKEGGPAQWNPYLFTGLPACEVTSMTGAPGRYYPMKMLLHRFLPANDAFMWLLFLHVVLMGAGMSVYLRTIGAGTRGALFGGVAYMFNGSAMVWLEFQSQVFAAAYLPLLLLCMERFLGARWLRAGLVGALLFGLMLLTGQIQYVSYAGLMTGFYLLFLLLRAYRSGRRPPEMARIVVAFGLMVAGGFLIASVTLLPALELMRQSSRIGRTFTFQGFFETLGRVPFRYLVTLIFPNYFGSPPLYLNIIPALPTQEYMNFNELCLYAGVPTLAAFLALCAARQNVFSRFYLGMTALVLGLVTGTFLYYPFFLLFPGMDRTNPTRLIFLFAFVLAVAAGLGLDRIEGLTPKRRTVFLALLGFLAAIALLVGLTAASPGSIRWFNRENLHASYGAALLQRLGGFRSFSAPAILKPLALTAAAVAGFAALALLASRRAAVGVFTALLALLAYDLISFGRAYNSVVERKHIYPRTPSLDFLARQTGPFRVLLDGGRGFLVNTMVPFGLQEVGGYSSFYPERIGRLMSFIQFGPSAFAGRRFDRWITFFNLQSPLFDLINVKYLLTAPGADLANQKLRLVHRSDMEIYENAAALPRTFVVHRAVVRTDPDAALAYMGSPAFDMRGEVLLERAPDPAFLAGLGAPAFPPRAAVTRYEPDRVEISAELAAAGWLVLTDTWYPGWRAEVDGREVPIERADCAYRALPLSAGRHAVVFSFHPVSVSRGRLLSGLGLALVIGGMALLIVRERRRAEKEAGGAGGAGNGV